MSEIKIIRVMEKILGANDEIADENRARLDRAGVFAVNLLSAPGSGKTTLLERTFERLDPRIRCAVIEGDVETSCDAERLGRFGIPLVQLNAPSCHLTAGMVCKALDEIDLDSIDLLFVENIGNLICPAGPKIGENHKVALLSVTEGHEKPLKYPRLFLESSLLIVHKIDLAPYTDFDIAQARKNAQQINPSLKILEVSSRTGEGLESWIEWLKARVQSVSRGL